MIDKDLKKKLLEAVSLIENTAQNQQELDPGNLYKWDTIETMAREMRGEIEGTT